MNVRKSWSRAALLCLLMGGVSPLLIASTQSAGAQNQAVDPDLTVHEWGTFTSVAGSDGQAVEWSPLSGSWPSESEAATVNDLPAFIEHFGYFGFKVGLRGTVRMETPVIYFYSPRNVDVSVHVSFSKGLITEWYPHAGSVTPSGNLPSPFLSKNNTDGAITWDTVHVEPRLAPELPRERTESHYYAARETSSTPVRVETAKGDQHEKFLFYRGVSAFAVPIAAKVTDGSVLVSNLGKEEIPGLILFERRGERIGYRLSTGLQNQVQLAPPELNGNVNSLYGDLEQMLVNAGLYWDESHAMVQTWQNSWFEEGSRLFYIMPASFVDRVLPLTIDPAPAMRVRVFVGRVELVTPETQHEVATAWAAHDQATLNKYSRFLEPILNIIHENKPAKAKQLAGAAGTTCNGEAAQKP